MAKLKGVVHSHSDGNMDGQPSELQRADLGQDMLIKLDACLAGRFAAAVFVSSSAA